jgi:serine/threonine-protein kinase
MDAIPKPTDPLIGARLDGRYLLTGVLGRGGMGIVYEGVHEALGRPVAVKVLSAAIAAEEVVVQRFLREARIAAGLGHGNIVDVSDLGHLPDGRPYLVMPRISGISFSDLLSQYGPQSPARVVELLRGVASALDLVHAKGLIHRDVKPENLMFVVREDGSETVMLMDFGIAVLISPTAMRLTGEGVVCGTPAYLAPESARGEDADHRVDVYALATVAFELITGDLPFDAENPLRILPMKAFRDPPRLSDRGDRQFPDAVETVMARGLARLPEERFETAGAFVQALEFAVNPGAAKRASLRPETQMLAAPKPRRMTESSELPAGSSDEIELEESLHASEPAPAAPAIAAIEQMETQLTPRSAAVQTVAGSPGATANPSSMPPAPPRSRRGVVAVIAASGFVLAGLVFALVWKDPAAQPAPPPRAPAVTARKPAPAPVVAPVVAQPAAVQPEPVAPLQPESAVQAAAPEAIAAREPARVTKAARSRPAQTAPIPPVAAPSPSPVAPATRAGEPSAPARAAAAPTAETADALNKVAGQALLQGHLARAADLYTQATVRDPRSAAAWRGLGLTSERLGRTRDAIRAYRRALQLAPTGVQAESVRERLGQLQ